MKYNKNVLPLLIPSNLREMLEMRRGGSLAGVHLSNNQPLTPYQGEKVCIDAKISL